jgi:hypothetical protein
VPASRSLRTRCVARLPTASSLSLGAMRPLGCGAGQSRSDALTRIIGAAGVDGLDDFDVVDALQVDGGDVEVAVAELGLCDDQRHTLTRHLDGVGAAELVRDKASADTCREGRRVAAPLGRSARPQSAARGTVDDPDANPKEGSKAISITVAGAWSSVAARADAAARSAWMHGAGKNCSPGSRSAPTYPLGRSNEPSIKPPGMRDQALGCRLSHEATAGERSRPKNRHCR